MGAGINVITTGHYKNSKIILNNENPVLVEKVFLGKREIKMDKTTIKTWNHSLLPNGEHEIIVRWNDEKLSQAVLDDKVYKAIVKKLS